LVNKKQAEQKNLIISIALDQKPIEAKVEVDKLKV
jgi:hypothetical protein